MACGSCASASKNYTFAHTSKDGKVSVYQSEVEAKAAVARRGGSYKKQ